MGESCCFTGHRSIPAGELQEVIRNTESVVRNLIQTRGVFEFRVGGAVGFDTLAANILLRLRDTVFPQIRVILTCPFEGFERGWTEEDRQEYARLLPQYDEVFYVQSSGSRGAFFARNRHMVDHSCCCVAYCNKDTGGTAYTIKYAEKHGKNVIRIRIDKAHCKL